MTKLSIVWDFDGTILPNEPYDSEQSLLIHAMHRKQKPFGWLKKKYARAMIYADQRERLRRAFKISYIWMLKGTPAAALDRVCLDLADKISAADRNALRRLKEVGYDMMVLSCGTVDLSERVLNFAGISDCFSLIEGNRFQFAEDCIKGMDLQLPHPEDKLRIMQNLKLSPARTIVVGDGYTDRPLFNWSSIPVIIDRDGSKKKQFTSPGYYFISSVPEIMNIIEENLL